MLFLLRRLGNFSKYSLGHVVTSHDPYKQTLLEIYFISLSSGFRQLSPTIFYLSMEPGPTSVI